MHGAALRGGFGECFTLVALYVAGVDESDVGLAQSKAYPVQHSSSAQLLLNACW